MKTALVCGAGGFIGGHLVKKLKREGYWVRGVDIKDHEFSQREDEPHQFWIYDLRDAPNCTLALAKPLCSHVFGEVYQLAADMGGMGYIHSAECDIMRNSALININMIDAAVKAGVPRYFFSSSVCVYPNMQPSDPEMTEAQALPANPDNEYGWEKLYAERMIQAYARNYPIEVRIARFQNCYGPEGTWRGGREKAPAAICRKVAEADDGGTIEVWGDGTAERSYTYVDDMVDGIYQLMQSDLQGPVNIGASERVSVDALVDTVIGISGKNLLKKYIDGPVGVQSRNFSKERISSLGWRASAYFSAGIARTYQWVEERVNEHRRNASRTRIECVS